MLKEAEIIESARKERRESPLGLQYQNSETLGLADSTDNAHGDLAQMSFDQGPSSSRMSDGVTAAH